MKAALRNCDPIFKEECVEHFSDQKNKARKHSVISLFSGCGGMDLGFLGGFEIFDREYTKNPFEIIWANDLNEAACRTYRRNLGHDIHCGDIWEMIGKIPKKADVLIGGFPCQDISINGKGAGIKGKRSGLYLAMVEAIRLSKPKIFIAENVKGLLMKHNADSLRKVISDFSSLGYDVDYKLFHAADYGIPQNRERVIIVGTKKGGNGFKFPTPTHGKNDWLTASHAIADLENLEEDPSINHVWSRANVSADQGNRRLKADRPSPTMRAECHGNIQFHYKLPRRISMREAARIQSFPDNFIFDAKLRETERQVGNAVPPILAWHIAQSVLDALKTSE